MAQETVPLRRYVEMLIGNVKESVKTAYASMEKRLEGMNEFRNQLDRQTRTFVDKDYFERHCETTNDRMVKLESFKEQMTGKADQRSVTNVLIISLIGLALSAVTIIISLGG